MNYCKKCNSPLKQNEKTCPYCGKSNEEKKETIYDKLELYSLFATIIIIAIYILLSCFDSTSAPNTDGSVSGLYIIIAIPAGLFMCELLPLVNYFISKKNIEKNKIYLSIIEIILSILTIFTLELFYSNLVEQTLSRNIFYYVSISALIIFISLLFLNVIMRKLNNKNS